MGYSDKIRQFREDMRNQQMRSMQQKIEMNNLRLQVAEQERRLEETKAAKSKASAYGRQVLSRIEKRSKDVTPMGGIFARSAGKDLYGIKKGRRS